MSGLSLSSEIAILPCPNCGQTINTSMQQCPYCAASIDHAAAASSAQSFAQVNQAISDASYLKIMAGTGLTFFLLRFVPFLSLIGVFGFWFLEAAIPVMTIRWWIKFGKLKSSDPEFRAAKKTALLFGIGATIFFALLQLGILLI